MNERTCTRCRETRPLSVFSRDASRPDGLHPWCTPCRAAAAKAYRAAHRERLRERHREWVAANPETMRSARRRHAEAHGDRRKARARAAYAADPARGRSHTAKWRNRPEFAEYNREMSRRHRALKRAAAVAPFTRDQLAARMAYCGNRCWICAGPFEQVDHVKPLAKGGPHMLANLRPICAPCNNRKRAKWPLTQEVLQSLLSH